MFPHAYMNARALVLKARVTCLDIFMLCGRIKEQFSLNFGVHFITRRGNFLYSPLGCASGAKQGSHSRAGFCIKPHFPNNRMYINCCQDTGKAGNYRQYLLPIDRNTAKPVAGILYVGKER